MAYDKGLSSSFCSILAGVLMISNCLLGQVCAKTSPKGSNKLGHMKPLGSHTPGLGVTATGRFPSSSGFYSEFVETYTPLWMMGVLESINHPGLTNWTDTFLKEKYGHTTVNVEVTRKENRKKNSINLTMKQFLKKYKGEDIYMVQPVHGSLEELVLIPPTLQCGGFQKVLQDSSLWLGSGKTSSVLHYDTVDNLLCVLGGQKDVILIDRAHKEDVEADGFVDDGTYSLVDVDKVDMERFPRLSNVSWKQVKLHEGDCLYIPDGWYHQVTSTGKRHFAINYNFAHRYWFNDSDCSSNGDRQTYLLKPISELSWASPNEILRSRLLGQLQEIDILTKHAFCWSFNQTTKERKEKFFDAVDKHKDSVLSGSELYGFDIDMAILHFPDVFGLPGKADDLPDDFVLYEPMGLGEADLFDDPAAPEESLPASTSDGGGAQDSAHSEYGFTAHHYRSDSTQDHGNSGQKRTDEDDVSDKGLKNTRDEL